jgi:hypothetical protein
MVAGNAYFDKSSGAAKFSNSHGTIGAVGIRFNSPSWNEGSLFTAGVVGSTADATFTPVDALRWDSSGRVMMPYQPSFKAGRSSSYTPGTGTDIVFNDVSSGNTHHNNGGHYSTSTGRFTAPVAGVYFFSALVIYQSLADGAAADDVFYITKNGSTATYSFRRGEYVNGITGNGAYYVDHANLLVKLAASDYVSVKNGRFNYDVHGNTNYTWFAGYLIG